MSERISNDEWIICKKTWCEFALKNMGKYTVKYIDKYVNKYTGVYTSKKQ